MPEVHIGMFHPMSEALVILVSFGAVTCTLYHALAFRHPYIIIHHQ
jgi:hypothetical protein